LKKLSSVETYVYNEHWGPDKVSDVYVV